MSQETAPERRGRADRVVAGVMLAFCATVYAYTFTFDEVPAALMSGLGAELFPRLILWLLAILAVMLVFNIASPPMATPPPIPREVWLTGAALFLFVAVLELVGMWPACILAIVGFGRMWGERNLAKLLAIAVVFNGALYLLFVRLLGGSFPRGLLGEAIWP